MASRYGSLADLPTAKQIDNRKRTLMTREGIIPRRISPKKLKAMQAQAEAEALAKAQAQGQPHPMPQSQPRPQQQPQSQAGTPVSQTHKPDMSASPSSAVQSAMLEASFPVAESSHSVAADFDWDQILQKEWQKSASVATVRGGQSSSHTHTATNPIMMQQDSIDPPTCSRSTANAMPGTWPSQGLGGLLFHP